MTEEILNIQDLAIEFKTAEGSLSAVRNLSFSLKKGETVCIVGESGCGKSISSLAIMGLLPRNGRIAKGSIQFEGQDLSQLKPDQMRKIRGNKISMIFQEPMTALNPVFTIGFQLREPLRIHQGLSKKEAHKRGIELLEQVGLSLPEQRMKQFPHELSGGMRQRVMIAIALACHPQILIADEPTTALDVTIQSQILELINDLKAKLQTGVVMITHDMGVVAETADRVVVMYAGEIVEDGTVEEIFRSPQHPYTQGLLASVPSVDGEKTELKAIPGSMPNINEAIEGCRFHPRCAFATDLCRVKAPELFTENGHRTKCWLKAGESIDESNAVPS
jgi:oligopeptide/dipeptide ABC transporter ATP-binding protein